MANTTSNSNYEDLFNISPLNSPSLQATSPPIDELSVDGEYLPPTLEARSSSSPQPRSSSMESGDGSSGSTPQHRHKRLRSGMDATQFVSPALAGKALQPTSVAELQAFARASPDEREVQSFALNLQIRDTIQEFAKSASEKYSIPEDLQTNIANYASAFIFAPGLAAYKTCAPKALVAVLRKGGITNLPNNGDKGRMSAINTQATKQLSNKQSQVKVTLLESINEYTQVIDAGSFTVSKSALDIGHVTLRILSGSDIRPTVKHLIRFAWIRFLLHHKVIADNKNFWDNVDKKRQELRAQAKKEHPAHPEVYISRVFSNAFDQDQAVFGKAWLDGLTEVSQLPSWQKEVEDGASRLNHYSEFQSK